MRAVTGRIRPTTAELLAGTSTRPAAPSVSDLVAAITEHAPDAALGWPPGSLFGAVDSSIGYRISNGSSSPISTTAADATSSDTTAFLGLKTFVQYTSAVANNTTALYSAYAMPGFEARPVYGHTFGFPTSVAGVYAVSSVRGGAYWGAGSASGTAVEETQSVGVSFLSGDTTWHAYCRAAGASVRVALGAAKVPVADHAYSAQVDARLYPASITVRLYDLTAGELVGENTFSTGLPTLDDGACVQIYCQTSTANVRQIAHAGNTCRPLGGLPAGYA